MKTTRYIYYSLLIGILLTYDIEATAQCNNAQDYAALRDLYLATNGDAWKDNEGWPNAATFRANHTPPVSTDMDDWEGVDCEDGRVVELELDENNLVGTLPNSLSKLTLLQELDVSKNKLSGGIPVGIANISSLKKLKLQNNQFSGCLPSNIAALCKWGADINLAGNASLPWQGSMIEYCKTNGTQAAQAGSPCISASGVSGTITADCMCRKACPPYTVNVILSKKKICLGESVTATFNFVGGTPGATYDIEMASGQEYNDVSSGFKITLAPSRTTIYTIEDIEDSNDCEPTNLPYRFTITVLSNNTVSTASSTPTVCTDVPIPKITHTTTGATGIGAASGLPPGTTATWSGGIISIQGKPSTAGTFSYSIPLTGGCGSATARGRITVKTCPKTCTLMPTVHNIVCNDNSTPMDSKDDTFTFDLRVSGRSTGSTWTANNAAKTTAAYDSLVTFGPFNISQGDVHFTIHDTQDTACHTSLVMTPPSICSEQCNISNSISNIICNDNMTPDNPNDDTYSFDVIVSGTSNKTTWIANDTAMTTGTYGNPTSFGPLLISDGNINFVITDSKDTTCKTTVNVIPPNSCSLGQPCSIEATTSNIICNDNDTPTDVSDDTFTFDLTISGANTGSTWTANDANKTIGSYNYPINLGPFNIADGEVRFVITDGKDPNCNTTVVATPPTTCSNSCQISQSVTNIVCDDKGTPSDPSDDTFTFEVTVSGTNTAASWTANDPNKTSGKYGDKVKFGPFNIADGNIQFVITDMDDAKCNTSVSVKPPSTCSNKKGCSISLNITDIECDDNDTPTNPSDDTFTFEVTVSGTNTAASWTANDPNKTSGKYGDKVKFGPFNIANGNIQFVITDKDDAKCNTSVNVKPPNTCSNKKVCSISHKITDIECDDNNTPTNPSDDTFTFEVTVSGTNTAASWSANDPNKTSGKYGDRVKFGPFNIADGNIQFVITDMDDAKCNTSVNVKPPNTCSNEKVCSISHKITDIECDDNNTPTNPSDDTFTFEVTVSGTNTASSWTANDPNKTSGKYGDKVKFGPFNIADGNIQFVITDKDDSKCNTSVSVKPPNTCSNEKKCNITHNILNIKCNDNNTPTNPSDDTFTFEVTVSGTNTASSWTANDPNKTSGKYGDKVKFGPFNIADGNIQFVITDMDDAKCNTSVSVKPPNTCSNEKKCNITHNILNIKCNDNNTPTNPSDDTFTFEVTVSGTNTAASWTANDPNKTSGKYGDKVKFGPFNIADGNVKFVITDKDDAKCNTSVSVKPPSTCSNKKDECYVIAMDDLTYAKKDETTDVKPLANDSIAGMVVLKVVDHSEKVKISSNANTDVVTFSVSKITTDTLWIRYEAYVRECDARDTASIFIVNKKVKDLVFPNYITPDGDMVNDVLQFSDDEILENSELWIYNRYGSRVFYQKNYTNDWGARNEPGGMYYYIFKYEDLIYKRMLIIAK